MTRRWLIRPEIKGIRMTADGKQAAGHQLSSLISCVYFIPWDLWTVYFSPSSLQKLGQLLAGRSAAAPLLASSHQCPCCLPLSSSQKDQIINLVGSHHSPQLSRDFLLQEQNLNSSFQSWGPTTHPLSPVFQPRRPQGLCICFPHDVCASPLCSPSSRSFLSNNVTSEKPFLTPQLSWIHVFFLLSTFFIL